MKAHCFIMTLSAIVISSFKAKNGLKSNKSFLAFSGSMMSVMMSSSTTSTKECIVNKSEVLKKFKEILQNQSIDTFIVPTDDPHLSEYTAPYYNRREFISGFTGSAGTGVITANQCLLFTDGRYHNQAELELDSKDWKLMKVGLKDVPTLSEYVASLETGSTVGVDPYLHAAIEYNKLSEILQSKKIHLKAVDSNPIDSVWRVSPEGDRPAPPMSQLRLHPIEYAGKPVYDKLKDLRLKLIEKNVTAIVAASLDEIAWLYNIRGDDVPCNPVSVSYAIVTRNDAYLFIHDKKVPQEVREQLLQSQVQIRPYEDAAKVLMEESLKENSKIWLDTKRINYAIYSLVESSKRFEAESPVVLMKAIKNDAELAGMKACHLRDGAAMAEFLSWLEIYLADKKQGGSISEYDIDLKLTEFRKSYGAFDLSFPTIAGVNSNGAIIHYRAPEKGCKMLGPDDHILLDSGGQYTDGTTDVTRTFHTGHPSAYVKEMFTRVLKGHIGIDSQAFPIGTAGSLIDSFAREHLWAIGRDFLHGVGHGVGAALNVHEGPHSISRNLAVTQPLVPGMIVSNEPGYYEDGNFGIRIENLLIVVKREDLGEYRGRSFLGFERLTHIPIQKKMIDVTLLSDKELHWLNKYHSEVLTKILPLVKTYEAKLWLEKACSPLTRENYSSN